MRWWRTIVSFFLLLLLAGPLLFLSFLQLKQLYIKHTLEERLESRLLKTVFIAQPDWKEAASDEILIAGRMFDVKEKQRVQNGFVVTGVFDDEETDVVQKLDQSCTANNAKDTPLFAHFFQLLDGLFFQTQAVHLLIATSVLQYFQNLILHLPSFYKQVLSPPPQAFA